MDILCDNPSPAAAPPIAGQAGTRFRVTGQKPSGFSIIVFATYCSLLTAVQSQMIFGPSALLPSA